MVSCHTADFKPVKQEVNSTVILLPLVFPGYVHKHLKMLVPRDKHSLADLSTCRSHQIKLFSSLLTAKKIKPKHLALGKFNICE